MGSRPLKLVKEVSGYAKPGTFSKLPWSSLSLIPNPPVGMLLALMGPSGAGKTTLLDVLASRKTGGHIEGTILVNGEPKSKFHRLHGNMSRWLK